MTNFSRMEWMNDSFRFHSNAQEKVLRFSTLHFKIHKLLGAIEEQGFLPTRGLTLKNGSRYKVLFLEYVKYALKEINYCVSFFFLLVVILSERKRNVRFASA